MVIFGRCTIILDLFYITVLASVLKISSSAYCLQGEQYYDSEKKQCLPCRTCKSPWVVITTCHIYSNTKCGLPTITNGGSHLEVSQETSSENSKNVVIKSHNRNIDVTTDVPKPKLTDPPFTVFNEENCSGQQNGTHKFIKKLCRPKLLKKDKSLKVNLTLKVDSKLVPVVDKIPKVSKPPDEHNFNIDSNFKSETTNSENALNDTSLRNFFFSFFGKVIVSATVISINLLLIIILIVIIIRKCYKRKSKDKSCSYSYNQKFPHPSQKPIKCRFTAVLPTKTSEYANVDSYLNSLISPTFSSNSNSSNWNNSCVSSTMPAYTPQETSDNSRSLGSHPINFERDPLEREPLILPHPEVVENANMVQLYSRIPSPNPFTMDRLLEHRRAIGCTSVENNLYVETWCSSTSPMLSRSQESSVTPSPALSSIRKPLSSSNSSSPLTTRTFRATPVFSSFHPNRS